MAVWSEVLFSETPEDLRFDAEYYKPEYLAQQDIITRGTHELLREVAEVSDGNHVAISDSFCSEGIRYLRGQDLKDFFISDADPLHIPVSEYKKLTRSHMKPGDVLVGIVGTIGSIGLVTDRHGPLTGNCKLAILRPDSMEPEYLAAFLASSVGQNELRRRIRGSVQMGLILPDLSAIPIPLIAEKTRLRIVDAVKESYSRRQDALSLYSQAEGLLLSELGLGELDLSSTLFYERDFYEAQQAARLDAEFFQPKHYALVDAIHQTGKGRLLADLVSHCERGLQPQYDDEGDVAVVNTKHMGTQFLSGDFERCSNKTWTKQKKAQLKQYDVLFYSTGAYIGRTNCWLGDEAAIGSNHVTIIRPTDECNPVYLALFMNSLVGLMQADRLAHGSAQREVYPNDLQAYTVWLPPMKKQASLAQMVLDAKAARDESHHLLEEAKRMVEEAVLGTTET